MFKANCLHVGLGLQRDILVGVIPSYPSPYLREILRKTTENSKRLGRQARLEIEPGTSHLPVLSAVSLLHWWCYLFNEIKQIVAIKTRSLHKKKYWNFISVLKIKNRLFFAFLPYHVLFFSWKEKKMWEISYVFPLE